jgi:hypothetical protein
MELLLLLTITIITIEQDPKQPNSHHLISGLLLLINHCSLTSPQSES